MPVAEQTQTYKETWRDWLDPDAPEPDQLLTRDEVVSELDWIHKMPVVIGFPDTVTIEPVSVGDLRYWESIGILPRPIRRRHEGAQRALYPEWYAPLASYVRLQQWSGRTLDEIRPRVRDYARRLISGGKTPPEQDIENADHIRAFPNLALEMAHFAQWHAALTGNSAESIAIHVTDGGGNTTLYPFPHHPSQTETPS